MLYFWPSYGARSGTETVITLPHLSALRRSGRYWNFLQKVWPEKNHLCQMPRKRRETHLFQRLPQSVTGYGAGHKGNSILLRRYVSWAILGNLWKTCHPEVQTVLCMDSWLRVSWWGVLGANADKTTNHTAEHLTMTQNCLPRMDGRFSEVP